MCLGGRFREQARSHILTSLAPAERSMPDLLDRYPLTAGTYHELALLTQALNAPSEAKLAELAAYSAPIRARRASSRVHNPQVEQRLAAITAQDIERQQPYEARAAAQRKRFNLPAWQTP